MTLRPRLAMLLLLLALPAAAFALGDRALTLDESKRIELFQKAFNIKVKNDDDEKSRRNSVNELKYVDHPQSAALILKLVFKDKDWMTRYEGVKAMSAYKFADTLEFIRTEGLGNSLAQVRSGCIEAATIGGMQDLSKDILAMAGDRDPDVRSKVAQALERMKPAGAAKTLCEMLDKESVDSAKVAILNSLAQFKDPACIPGAAACLQSDQWQLQSAAIAALRAIRTKDCVGPLVDAFQSAKKGRLKIELQDALEFCTGKYFGDHAETWANWWKVAQEKFTVPEISELSNDASAIKPKDTWFGIPFEATESNIIFVIDLSNSMNEKIKYTGPGGGKDGINSGSGNGQPEGVGSGDGAGQGNDANPDPRKKRVYTGTTKLAIVKEELAYAIAEFDETTNFNIIMFNTESDMVMLHQWKKSLTSATEKSKKDAVDWVRNREAEGRTPICDAVLEALKQGQERPVEKGYASTGADTIFVLSDGEPSDGIETDWNLVVDLVTQANALKKIQIHCIAAGHYNNETLKGIAARNWGAYVEIGETQ